MVDDLIHREVLIRELLLLRKIIIQCRSQLRGTAVEHSRTVQYPLLLRDVVIPNATGVGIDTGKQLPVNGDIFIRRETKGTLRKQRSNPCGYLVGLLSTI